MAGSGSGAEPERTPRIPDPTAAHSSRTYDYLLGGKDHLAADRELMAENLEVLPTARIRVRAQRFFLERAVRFLVAEAGVRQILDVGCGMPQSTSDNVHEIAQRIAPDTRVAYVDNNAVAVAHMGALQAYGERTVAFHGDLREPEAIVNHPDAATLDFSRPVGVLLVSVLQCLPDDTDPAGIMARLRNSLAPGSFVALSHISADLDPKVEDVVRVWQNGGSAMVQRSRADLDSILTGFELVEPGLVPIHEWRPDGTVAIGDAYGAVAFTT